MTAREWLQTGKLLFDGAMGTLYQGGVSPCERANLEDPEGVLRIHEAYIRAGAQAIKTNSFGANSAILEGGGEGLKAVISASFALAKRAAGERALVFADVGPIPVAEPLGEYLQIADCFLELGADHFLFETFPSFGVLGEVFAHIKQKKPESFILCSFAVSPDGFSADGLTAQGLLSQADRCPWTDAVGLNCVSGPFHLLQTVKGLKGLKKPLSVMPNSGSPKLFGSRVYFPESPRYFAGQMAEIAAFAAILGGCCGTGPDYIASTRRALEALGKSAPAVAAHAEGGPKAEPNPFLQKLKEGRRVLAVELDPPQNLNIEGFMRGAERLKKAGVDLITIADCPIARVRADSSMLAAKLKRELGVEPLPHMTCRDRNLNAAKALLLGLGIEGIQNLLAVTGDPVSTADRQVKGVFNFNSVALTGYIAELGEQTGRPIAVSCALDVNAKNFAAELQKAQKKCEAGAVAFFTQPVYGPEAIANLRQAKTELQTPILCGILPIVSYKNALYLQNEVVGVKLPREEIERFNGLERAKAEELSLRLCRRVVDETPFADGYYLITPFGRVSLIVKLMDYIRGA
ncbi:MAG: bifunctional homocysteine S-methyltransferase/methylenetetrahydrofolate reductase [Christensenellaceae bacterium]|jgi:homocysteine S-methyltransferase|nr:bifunctional homocysteine S-methyltransferase/methylenetetrahydrofolate reductase [Christensenellaceae bacterium]